MMQHQPLAAEPTNRGERTEPLSRAIVEAVAEAEGADPTELTPLYSAIDPDAMEALFRTRSPDANDQFRGEIRFSYHGYEVRVTADGEVDLAGGPDR